METIVRRSFLFVFVIVLAAASPTTARAASITIRVQQDVSVMNSCPTCNFDHQVTPFLIVRQASDPALEAEAMFGFDLSSFSALSPSLTINSMTFSAYNNADVCCNFPPDPVHIAVGNTDTWSASTATFANSAGNHGSTLSSAPVSYETSQNSFVSWDVTNAGFSQLLDGYITFYLYVDLIPSHFNLHDFQAEEFADNPDRAAYLTIDYTVAEVPEPSSLVLLSTGTLALFRRRAHAFRRRVSK